MEITVEPVETIRGQIRVPGDKSISHRALLLSSLAEEPVEIEGLLKAADISSTQKCLQDLGTGFVEEKGRLKVSGQGLRGFKEPQVYLDAGNSGTTARLLAGLLAGQPFISTLTGDESLRRRPMKRVTEPLRQMGASISGREDSASLPLTIRGGSLVPISYSLPVASAQVKSALLIAALYCRGITSVIDPFNTRDHTERALRHLGADIKTAGRRIMVQGPARLAGGRFSVPGDISAAAFFIVAAALTPRGELYIENLGVNPTRSGLLDLLKQMGADLRLLNERERCGEPVADLLVKGGRNLRGIKCGGEIIPRLIDEIPALAVAALFAEGETTIRGASELRVKETDRIRALAVELRKMGARIKERPDGLVIEGGAKLNGACCHSHGDHRMAMALATAALFAESESIIEGAEAVKVSFPNFFNLLKKVAS